jgi:hypothetical protein
MCDFWVCLQSQSKPRINQCLEVVLLCACVSREAGNAYSLHNGATPGSQICFPAQRYTADVISPHTQNCPTCVKLCVYTYVRHTQIIRKLTLNTSRIISLIKNNMKWRDVFKTAVLWDYEPCSLTQTDPFARKMIQALSISENSVNVYQNTGRNFPEDIHLHTLRCEKGTRHRQALFLSRKMLLKTRTAVTSCNLPMLCVCITRR